MASIDVWSLGCILYEMLNGKKLFGGTSREEITEKIKKYNYKYSYKITSEANDLISKMLKTSPLERISIKDCLIHSWVLGNISSLIRIEDENLENMDLIEPYNQIVNSEPNQPSSSSKQILKPEYPIPYYNPTYTEFKNLRYKKQPRKTILYHHKNGKK